MAAEKVSIQQRALLVGDSVEYMPLEGAASQAT
jgi:hypothetical protein